MEIPKAVQKVLDRIQIRPDETTEPTKQKTANDWIDYLKSLKHGELIRGEDTIEVLRSHKDVILKIRDTWDSPKGWMFAGCYGCGKTRLMQTIQLFKPIVINDSLSVQQTTEEAGYVLNVFTGKNKFGYMQDNDEVVFCLDDFGREDDKCQIWVNGALKKIYVGSEIIYERYKNKRKFHLITNYKNDYLTDKYGGEIVSRLSEMFHVIHFPNKDYRIKNGGLQ